MTCSSWTVQCGLTVGVVRPKPANGHFEVVCAAPSTTASQSQRPAFALVRAGASVVRAALLEGL